MEIAQLHGVAAIEVCHPDFFRSGPVGFKGDSLAIRRDSRRFLLTGGGSEQASDGFRPQVNTPHVHVILHLDIDEPVTAGSDLIVLRYSGLGERQSARLTSVHINLEKSAAISEDNTLAIAQPGDGGW